MNMLVIILIIIIFILIIYLFLIKKEIKRISHNLDEILNIDSNEILHGEFSNKELNELLLKINKMITYVRHKELDLERKNNSLKKEITNITHDLRTPLTSSLGYIDLILKSNLSKQEQERELKIIENRLLRLEELINSFFEFSMITTDNKKIDTTQINLVGVVEECISHYYDDFTKEKRKIVFEKEINKCIILSNTEILKRIIDNLISNSLKHSNSDLIIKLSEKNDIRLSFENNIVDTSIDIDHIFDEFYTSDISRTKGNTGLGLAIAKEFTEMLGGTISAKKIRNKLVIKIIFNE
ncbi:MAG: HAMP domain-containing histidine kinase [Bacilli bacterium]|nr:HAMP domain-containing histidine kinase [Bacilli bacterium]